MIAPSGKDAIGVREGCCADLKDLYIKGQWDELRYNRRLGLVKSTTIPVELLKNPRTISAEREIVLRSQPEVEDTYNEGASHITNRAVFGNIVRRYLPGAKGQVLATQSLDGRIWAFVAMVEDDDILVTHDPFEIANVGWVELNSDVSVVP